MGNDKDRCHQHPDRDAGWHGACRHENVARRLLRLPAAMLIGFYRNTPALVHFFWIYYALPVITPLTFSPFTAAVIALSAQSGAFYAEVYRGAISSIHTGQWEGPKR